MDIVLHIVHALSALALIVFILLQQGKGAEAGASFGAGASQTMFGGNGSGNFMTRATAVLAVVFMVTSLGLAWMARHNASAVTGSDIPAISQALQQQQTKEAAQEEAVSIPALDDKAAQEAAESVTSVPSLSADQGTSQETTEQ